MAASQKLLQHPSILPILLSSAKPPTRPAQLAGDEPSSIHGRVGGEAGARAAALQPAHRRAHRGGLHPVPRAVRRRAGGAGDHVAEGARHDVPQGRVGGGRVHGRGRPARGPRGGRRPRRHRAGARLLALQEPPLRRPDLRGLHVPAPRRRRAPPVARDGLPQAHLGNGEPGDGRVPALVDAGGAREARRPARHGHASVRSLIRR
ncbi:hypothetical protein C2845_PM12G26600 [Panicum miliaceum]|uniref:Uncharacterized protein n=1 Tax=Panicum miliaceum TaxID=4540 RepID=A0A3L6QFL6_PANMI|nr:hypothetical protein C2845_PM12G26600 [Panicum miliaceum]